MTQKDVAEILEVEPGRIHKDESGIIEPNIESLKMLAETFNIIVDELINDEEKFDVSKINLLDVLRQQKEMQLKGNLYHNTQIKFAYNTNHIEGSKLTEEMIKEFHKIIKEGTIKDIIEFHVRFEKIHLFQEGNGRVDRISEFKECLKNNIIPFIILDKDKLFYYRRLKEYQNKTEKGYLIHTCLNTQD